MSGAPNRTAGIAADALETAAGLVTGERAASYGDFSVQCERVAALWAVLLDAEVAPQDVARCLIALKLVRSMTAPALDLDSEVDMAGYAALLAGLKKVEAPCP